MKEGVAGSLPVRYQQSREPAVVLGLGYEDTHTCCMSLWRAEGEESRGRKGKEDDTGEGKGRNERN